MKTTVNFYRREKKRVKFEPLTFKNMLILFGALFVIMSLATAVMVMMQKKASAAAETQEQAASKLEDDVAQLEALASNETADPELERKLRKLRLDEEAAEKLSGVISSLKSDSGQDFSDLLLDLARVADGKVYIGNVSVEGGMLSLGGVAEKASDAAEFAGRLRNSQSFRGRKFSGVSVTASAAYPGTSEFAFTGFDQAAADAAREEARKKFEEEHKADSGSAEGGEGSGESGEAQE